MSAMASQITAVPIVYSTVCSVAVQRKRQSSASLASPVTGEFPAHKGPAKRKMFSIDDVIISICNVLHIDGALGS